MGGIVIAFKELRLNLGILHSPWNGVENFRTLFASQDFLRALRNTVVISMLRLSVGFFAPIALALLLNEVRVGWFKRTVQTASYLPHFFSWVILGGMCLLLFSLHGPVNALLGHLGLGPVEFLTHDSWFLVTLIATGIWQAVGYGAVIYLAALAGISPTLYEAAMVDGAGRWQQLRHITLPALTPTMVTLFILSLAQILNAGFDQIYNMYNPMVYDVADILDTYVLRRLLAMDYGLATAADLFKSVVGLVLIVSVNSIVRRVSRGEQGIL
jgi:putative aldouronate transport system permease protein